MTDEPSDQPIDQVPATVPTPEPTPEQTGAEAARAALRRVSHSTSPAKPRSKARRSSATFTNDRDPQLLGEALDRLMRDQGWEDQSAVAVLMGEWTQIVGADLADHVVPVSFDEGELVLQAASTTWATQVRLLLPQVQKAVDERVGRGVVRRIRIQGPQAPNWSAGPRRVKGRGPRDTYG